MARITSLNVLLSASGKDMLAEAYGAVVENVQKRCISQLIKNSNLSGTPKAGTLEAKRFENKTSNVYGTARQGGAGQAVKATPVVVAIDQDKEIVVEAEQKDISLYGVDGLLEREAASAEKAMVRELEKAFFAEAISAGAAFTTSKTDIVEIMEDLIQSVETVQNDFVDGVERDMIAVVCSPATYGQLRTYFDKVNDGGAQGEGYATFHGVKIFSSVYLPSGTNAVAMAEGSIAQPVLTTIAPAERIQFSEAIGFGLFYHYGTKAVAADLIFKY